MMMYLISYDIESDSLRTRIANRLLDDGLERLQYSVYLGILKENVHKELLIWLPKMLKEKGNPNKDSIIIIQLGKEQVKNMQVIGQQNIDIPELIGDKHTLIW